VARNTDRGFSALDHWAGSVAAACRAERPIAAQIVPILTAALPAVMGTAAAMVGCPISRISPGAEADR